MGAGACSTGIAVAAGVGHTGAAVGALAFGGLACAVTFGIGCAVAVGVVVAGAAASKITTDACDNPQEAQLAEVNAVIRKIDQKLGIMIGQLHDLTGEVKKLGTQVVYSGYTNKIQELMHAYNDIKFDKHGLVDTSTTSSKHYVNQFVHFAFTGGQTSLKLALDRFWDMIKGKGPHKSMYKQAYFCKAPVRQYYNMLLLQGYDLLFKARAMKGLPTGKNLENEFRDRILASNELALKECGE